jgi:peptidyl-prolyl cis-trans isomerase C
MRVLREPLLHFLVLGALVFTAARHFEHDADRYRIDAGPAQRARIATTYRQQYGIAPTEAQLQYLLDQYVRSEILFREGVALGLDRDDEIVRRRVVQKIEFLNEDADTIATNDRELETFFASHQSRYVTPASVSFTQLYFSADPRGEAAAHARAEAAMASLRKGASSAHGDRFDAGDSFAPLSERDAPRVFGDSQLSAALFNIPAGEWAGPFRSAYGWHLVRIERHESAKVPPLDSVKDRVRADYLTAERERRNEAEFKRLAAKYHIVTDGAPT